MDGGKGHINKDVGGERRCLGTNANLTFKIIL